MLIDYVYARFTVKCHKFDPSSYAIRAFIHMPDQGKTSPPSAAFENYKNAELCKNLTLHGSDEAQAEATKLGLSCAAKFERTITNLIPATSASMV